MQLSKYNKRHEIELQEQELEIRELLKDCTSLFELDAERKGIKLILDVDEKVPKEIIQDPAILSQLICLLLSNSMKYTSLGYISISMTYHSEDPASEDSERIMEIEIKDTGIGISEEEQKHLFKMYSEGYDQNTEFGTGIGLTLSQAIVHSMKGTIKLISRLGEGTTIRLHLPCLSEYPFCSYSENILTSSVNRSGINFGAYQIDLRPSMNPSEMNLMEQGIVRNMDIGDFIEESKNERIHNINCNCVKILVVDDVPSNIFILTEMLKIIGHTSDQASNGQEAIEKVKKSIEQRAFCCRSYKLILMDCNMPIMDG